MTDVTVLATTYTVCALPEGHPDFDLFAITVENRSSGRWAVLRHRWCLGSDGEWDFEPRPSEREDDWLATHRFPLKRALELAQAEAPKVRVNHRGVAEALAAYRSGEPR
jgi:hypothetical protein